MRGSSKRGLSAQAGVTVMLVMVFMGVFAMVTNMLAAYLLTQSEVGRAKYAREQAVNVAEAGLEYYRWFLAHNPNDLTNGTGQPGPYTYTVNDPEGGTIGTASLTITASSSCGVIQAVEILSEGTSDADARFKRKLSGRYARPSVAEYSHIINSNVWAGADRNIVGPYHSNGGIRMDGSNNSIVSSPNPTWLCTSSFGCNPSSNKNGVFGAGSGSALWRFPPANSVNNFNFAGIGSDFAALKGYAQTQGRYFGTVNTNGRLGYHMILRNNSTVDVYRVNTTNWHDTIHIDLPSGPYVRDYDQITGETFLGNYAIPASCPIIFAEDNIWLEGTVAGKVLIVAADPESTTTFQDIWLQGNIGYTSIDGSAGLTAIAERSVLYGYNIPDVMSVRGIFVAQSGYYGRNLYRCVYAPYDKRSSLTLHGSVISNGRVGTKWGYSSSGCSNQWSGFNVRVDSYDRLLAFFPPPFTPFSSADFKFIIWKEQ